jgi:signal transduction histidine kinase
MAKMEVLMQYWAAFLDKYSWEFNSPMFPFHVGAAVLVFAVVVVFVWYLARAIERRHFQAMLRKLSDLTLKLKDAEHFGHFGSFSWDRDDAKSFWSEEMFNLFNLVPGQHPPGFEKVVGMILQEDREKAGASLLRTQEIPGEFNFQFRVLAAGNVIKYLRFEGKSIFGRDKKWTTIEGVAQDITREIEIDRAKSEFVSLASHQLKTPLTAISWLTEALLAGDKGSLNDEQRKYIENIHHTDRTMMEMVNDLLNVSRIELGTLQLRPEEMDIAAFAHSVVDEQKKTADDKRVTVALNFETNLPRMKVDKNLMRMVFQNLMSNAIKYTPTGGTVTMNLQRGSGMSNTVFVSVADTGIGIPKDEQAQIFSKLHRAKNA